MGFRTLVLTKYGWFNDLPRLCSKLEDMVAQEVVQFTHWDLMQPNFKDIEAAWNLSSSVRRKAVQLQTELAIEHSSPVEALLKTNLEIQRCSVLEACLRHGSLDRLHNGDCVDTSVCGTNTQPHK